MMEKKHDSGEHETLARELATREGKDMTLTPKEKTGYSLIGGENRDDVRLSRVWLFLEYQQ